VITYTLAQTPVAPVRRVDGASEEARIFAEVCERLLEIEGEKFGEAKALVRRLAALSDISERGFLLVLRFGAGDTGALLASYEEQVKQRGVTRQAAHWQWQQDVKAIKLTFPAVAGLLAEYRESVRHKEDGVSAADGLRAAMDREDETEAPVGTDLRP
jgi:hypothetical protein